VLGTPRLTALKLLPETRCSSDHNSNLKWAILGTRCTCLLPRKDFFNRVISIRPQHDITTGLSISFNNSVCEHEIVYNIKYNKTV